MLRDGDDALVQLIPARAQLMALDRKDVRFKLDHDEHAALARIAEADQLDIAEFVEREIVRVVHERSLKATLLAEDDAIRGIAGKIRESQGRRP